MKRFRKVIFWMHLISGVVAGIFIFIMCVTGALLSFEKNIIAFAERDMSQIVVPADAARLSTGEIVARAVEARPGAKPSAVALQNDPRAAVLVSFGRDGQVYVDPYTGAITGEGATGVRSFFRTMTDWHRWLALSGENRQIGKSIMDAANFLFLFLAVSGVYIWFPRQWTRKHFGAVLWFRRTTSGKARDFNWHNVIGFWCSLVLIILTLTGVIISYQWASNLLYTLTGNEVPRPQQQQSAPGGTKAPEEQKSALPENIEAAVRTAENHTSWKSLSLRLPVTKDEAVFTVDEGIYWNIFARSTLTVDAKTGAVVKWEPYGEQNAARQLRSWARFTHTGETGGFIGQLIGCIACLGGAVLVWTGISLALRRFAGWRRRTAVAEISE